VKNFHGKMEESRPTKATSSEHERMKSRHSFHGDDEADAPESTLLSPRSRFNSKRGDSTEAAAVAAAAAASWELSQRLKPEREGERERETPSSPPAPNKIRRPAARAGFLRPRWLRPV